MDLGKLNEAEVKPDFADLDKDGDKEEPMKDAAEDAKEEDSEEDEESDDKEKSDDEKKGKGKLNPGLQAYLDNKGKK